MSYPQPLSDLALIEGFNFFRLNSELVSPGDIFESTQSSYAICVGPDSDIANYGCAYFDTQAPDNVQLLTFSPQRGFSGLIPALAGQYAPSGRPGKTLFWSNDLFDPAYVPSAGIGAGGSIERVQPIFDVIQYFTEEPSITPQRTDKVFFYQQIPIDIVSAGTSYVIIPFYGRKSASIRFANAGNGSLAFGVLGVTYYAVTLGKAIETVIHASALVAAGAQVFVPVTFAANGAFDAIVCSVGLLTGGTYTAGDFPLTITVSDQE